MGSDRALVSLCEFINQVKSQTSQPNSQKRNTMHTMLQ